MFVDLHYNNAFQTAVVACINENLDKGNGNGQKICDMCLDPGNYIYKQFCAYL